MQVISIENYKRQWSSLLICDNCGVQDYTVWATLDPYALEIEDEQVPTDLCDCCYQAFEDAI